MIKKCFSVLITVALCLGLMLTGTAAAGTTGEVWSGETASGFDGGSGTENDPYQIATPEQLAYLAEQVSGGNSFEGQYIQLTADIWLNDTSDFSSWSGINAPANEWSPIGSSSAVFQGSFDGGNHTVYGLYLVDYQSSTGLFSYVSGGTVKNLILKDAFVYGRSCTGIIAGTGSSATFQNCFTNGYVYGDSSVGGIVGNIGMSHISLSTNFGTVSGRSYVGGISGKGLDTYYIYCANHGAVSSSSSTYAGGVTGQLTDGTISNDVGSTMIACTNSGSVYAGGGYGGGIAGSQSGAVISNCVNSGTVYSNDSASYKYLGGISGAINNKGQLYNCANTGGVSGYYAGGIVGYARLSTISVVYNTGTVTGSYSGALAGYLDSNDGNPWINDGYYYSGSSSAICGHGTADAPVAMSLDSMRSDAFASTLNAAAASQSDPSNFRVWTRNAVTNSGFPVPDADLLLSLSGIEITVQPSNTLYQPGESFDPTGMTVSAALSDGSTGDVTASAQITVLDSMDTPGSKTVQITCEGYTAQTQVYVCGFFTPAIDGSTVTVEYVFTDTDASAFVLAAYDINGKMIGCTMDKALADSAVHQLTMTVSGTIDHMTLFQLDAQYAPVAAAAPITA